MAAPFAGKKLVAHLAAKGARDPEALAAWIGRQKYGRTAFQKLAAAGMKQAQAKADARAAHQEVMSRVRPGGTLAHDLTGFSDHELGQVLSDLTTPETLRVAAELDRRDTAAGLP